ncbi:MAG: hypothetical protein Q8933_20185 [Bacteroidota bacterium]|nr:hypothetical protein [Bacteroidota bacterium]
MHDTTKVVAPDLIFKNIFNVQKVQIVQNRIGHASFYIVKGNQYDNKDERLIKTRISSHLGSNFQFDIVYANKLQLNKNGKIPFVIHNVE